MNTITITILLIIAAFSGMYVGYCSARSNELDRWDKMLHKLDIEKADLHFSTGALWAYDIVLKEKDIDYEHKAN